MSSKQKYCETENRYLCLIIWPQNCLNIFHAIFDGFGRQIMTIKGFHVTLKWPFSSARTVKSSIGINFRNKSPRICVSPTQLKSFWKFEVYHSIVSIQHEILNLLIYLYSGTPPFIKTWLLGIQPNHGPNFPLKSLSIVTGHHCILSPPRCSLCPRCPLRWP